MRHLGGLAAETLALFFLVSKWHLQMTDIKVWRWQQVWCQARADLAKHGIFLYLLSTISLFSKGTVFLFFFFFFIYIHMKKKKVFLFITTTANGEILKVYLCTQETCILMCPLTGSLQKFHSSFFISLNNLWCWSEGLFFLHLTSSLGWMDGLYLIEQFLCS